MADENRAGRADATTFAERIHDGRLAESMVEDRLCDIWPDVVHHISTDSYDNSLEVYFDTNAPPDLASTEEEARQIIEWGFDRFWLNFTDGTEQHGGKDRVGKLKVFERHKVSHPRWTEEMASRW